jgi:two-component system, OmpR family, sensor kinase
MTVRPLAAGRRLLARTPLQVKLIAAVLALVTVALALIGLASVAALNGYLVGRLDDQLQAVARQPGRPPGEFRGGPQRRPGPPSPFLIQYRDPAGKVVDTDSAPLDEGQPPAVPDDRAWLAAHAGRPVTVPAAGGGGSWRVLVQETASGSKVVAASLEGIDATIRQLRLIDLGVSLIVLAVLAGLGRPSSGRPCGPWSRSSRRPGRSRPAT